MIRSTLVAAVMLALLSASASAVAQAVPGGPVASDGYFEVIEPLAKGVWLIRQGKPFHVQPIGNVTVVEQSDGLVMVDAGGSPGSGRRIVGLVKSVSSKPVKAVIVSQWHGDKPLGLPAILQAWPKARVISTEATRRHLADPKTMNTPGAPDAKGNAAMLETQKGLLAYVREQAGKASTEADRQGWAAAERLFTQYVHDMDGALTLQPGEGFGRILTIEDAKAPVEARFLGRADTDGDAVVWMPRQRILVAGETVVAPIPFGFESYPGEWLEVLKTLRAYDFRLLVPGHGAPQARPSLPRPAGGADRGGAAPSRPAGEARGCRSRRCGRRSTCRPSARPSSATIPGSAAGSTSTGPSRPSRAPTRRRAARRSCKGCGG